MEPGGCTQFEPDAFWASLKQEIQEYKNTSQKLLELQAAESQHQFRMSARRTPSPTTSTPSQTDSDIAAEMNAEYDEMYREWVASEPVDGMRPAERELAQCRREVGRVHGLRNKACKNLADETAEFLNMWADATYRLGKAERYHKLANTDICNKRAAKQSIVLAI